MNHKLLYSIYFKRINSYNEESVQILEWKEYLVWDFHYHQYTC